MANEDFTKTLVADRQAALLASAAAARARRAARLGRRDRRGHPAPAVPAEERTGLAEERTGSPALDAPTHPTGVGAEGRAA